jgi:hypothetical protein
MLLLDNFSNFDKEEEEEEEEEDDDADKEPCSCNISLIRSMGAVMVLAKVPAIAPAIAFLKASLEVVVVVVVELLLLEEEAADGLVTTTTDFLSVTSLLPSFHSGLGRFILKVLY